MKPDYGMNDLMVTAAFRYCLGRQTYIVGECAEWLIRIWPKINSGARFVIQRELDQAFVDDDKDRAAKKEWRTLGADCDRKEWEKVRNIWATHLPPQPAHS